MDHLLSNLSGNLMLWQAFIVISLVLWFYCIFDVLRNDFEKNEKLIWLITVVFVPFAGAMFYLFFGKRRKLS